MINRISNKITDFLCKNLNIESDMVDVYKYGIEITMSSFLNIFWIVVIGMLLSDIISALIFLSVFVFLRSFTGGYHADTYFKCNLVFVLTFLIVYYVGNAIFVVENGEIRMLILEVIALLGFAPVIAFTPVENKNKVITKDKAKLYRRISPAIYIALSLVSLYLNSCGIVYGSFIIITVAAVAVMILIEILMQRRSCHGTEKNCCKDDCECISQNGEGS